MFIELSKEIYEKLKPHLVEQGIYFEASDCTLPGEEYQMIHLEFKEPMPEKDIEYINKKLDALIPEKEVKAVRRRKWNERMHTPKEEFMGYMSGKSTEEEIIYESK